MVYLETGHKKYNYFTEEEVKTFTKDELLLQASLGLQSCKQVKDAVRIMEDVWQISKEKEKEKFAKFKTFLEDEAIIKPIFTFNIEEKIKELDL